MSIFDEFRGSNDAGAGRGVPTPWEFTTLCPQTSEQLPLYAPHFIELVEGSGLSAETIRQNGIYSTSNLDRLKQILNWKEFGRKNAPAMVFPYVDHDGALGFSRVKPNGSIKLNNGKPAKYLSPTGSGVGVYFPAATRSTLQVTTIPIYITEGEKKSLKATQDGFPCVGLGGVDCWHTKGSKALHPQLRQVVWKDREVFIVFDSDAADNDSIRRNELKLATALDKQGAVVRIVRLPPGENGEKVGVDDYLVKHGAEAFRALVLQAQTTEEVGTTLDSQPPDSDSREAKKNFDARDEAKAFLLSHAERSISTWRYYRGEFWRWRHGSYKPVDVSEVEPTILNYLAQRAKGVTSRDCREVLSHLKSLSLVVGDRDPPFWIEPADGLESLPPWELLSVGKQIVHLRSLVSGKTPNCWPATPALFGVCSLSFEFDPIASRPTRWLGFLQSIWPDDRECIDTLQEIFGYLLTADTSQQKIFMLVGPPRSGKGTIVRVLNQLVGPSNVASPTLSSLATNFGLWPLLDRSVATINDARLSSRTDLVAIVERLLSISGEDTMTIDRKYRTPITARLPTRFVVSTNELPRLTDASAAIVSRILLLEMQQSFLGREDRTLSADLSRELPGILCWAIQGWKRLDERGQFIQPASSADSLGELRDLASPISAFVNDRCEIGANYFVSVDEVFDAWKRWAESQGRERYVGTKQTFSRDLHAISPAVHTRRPTLEGKRTRVFEGLRLRD